MLAYSVHIFRAYGFRLYIALVEVDIAAGHKYCSAQFDPGLIRLIMKKK